MPLLLFTLVFCLGSAPLLLAAGAEAATTYTFPQAQALVKTYCLSCHQGKSPAGGFSVEKLSTLQSFETETRAWRVTSRRMHDGEMPPKGVPAPSAEEKTRFTAWVDHTLRTAACSDGISPGLAPMRRLNRSEYSATIRDLLNIHINAAHALPADGAGGEGFDNAAETLFLSPIHAEKYLEAAKQSLDYAMKDPKARGSFLIAEPTAELSAEAAAGKVLAAFLPKAFRRPVSEAKIARHVKLFAGALRRGDAFDQAILFSLQAVLVSPHFLFRLEDPNPAPEPRLLGDYALASRLSYFLWGSMPDQVLLDLAAQGKLQEPRALRLQMVRMLRDVKARDFAENFTEQWLGTRELGRDIKPDPKLFPAYSDLDLQGAIRYEPVLFLQEILAENLSLLNLIDSKWTILNKKLQAHYGLELKDLNQQPQRSELPQKSHRGGVLGMSAVLAVSSYPQRTSPVLRGKWILETLLGTPPPPPPPNVPELQEAHEGEAPATLRERLMQHRANPACATCHDRIDPLGFALENYDVLGRWRTEENGKPLDTKGQLPDGTAFEGVDQLKTVLLGKKELFLRNFTAKMLGYALGRGLNLEEHCTVDSIVNQLEWNEYSAHTLIREIILSVPFRYQAGTVSGAPVPSSLSLTRDTVVSREVSP